MAVLTYLGPLRPVAKQRVKPREHLFYLTSAGRTIIMVCDPLQSELFVVMYLLELPISEINFVNASNAYLCNTSTIYNLFFSL